LEVRAFGGLAFGTTILGSFDSGPEVGVEADGVVGVVVDGVVVEGVVGVEGVVTAATVAPPEGTGTMPGALEEPQAATPAASRAAAGSVVRSLFVMGSGAG
jgi:hypothetical protein